METQETRVFTLQQVEPECQGLLRTTTRIGPMQHQDKVTEVEPVCLFAVSDSLVYGINICENCLVEYITDDGDRYPPLYQTRRRSTMILKPSITNNHSFVSVIRFNKERVRELRALRELTQPHQLLSP